MTLADSVTQLRGIGEEAAKKFSLLGVQTYQDLLEYFPRRYDDFSAITPIAKMKPGTVTIKATISNASGKYVRRGLHITEAVANDESSSVRLVWFHQPYRAAAIKPGQEYFISGEFKLSRQRFSVMNPSIELVSDFPVNTARIVPIYRETKGLHSRQIRSALKQIVPLMHELPETLPRWIIDTQNLMHFSDAIEMIHFPSSSENLRVAQYRLGFDEVFELSLASLLNKQEIRQEIAPPVPFDPKIAQNFVTHLPFKLTEGQRKTAWQIYQDMEKPSPMNRLLEGDVGSGKTAVAAMAALMVLHRGHQAAMMAPTELLARQHLESLQKMLAPLSLDKKIGLLVGGMAKSEKDSARKRIQTGETQFIVGTQALIQESLDMKNLELVIIDEQHRFGVDQRKKLMHKSGHMPHVLSLTATPIPRSLALTLFGELDISILDEKPPGRLPVKTKICSPNSRAQLYAQIAKELASGRQMFVVCPLISESEKSSANSAEKTYAEFAKKYFKNFRVGLLHGKMKAAEKQAIMQKFVGRELDILVSTIVIEVGVDVPNASVMLIEGADSFGLAQIHQLRGRVGRSGQQGYCFLMMSDSSAPSRRLRALESSSDGFKLAELDLEIRGPGAIYGAMQHGQLDLRLVNLADVKLIANARSAAQEFLEKGGDMLQFKQLDRRVRYLRAVTNLN
jgi:ATP-dependent DNA helicase RecG